jgi:hypothetical protein
MTHIARLFLLMALVVGLTVSTLADEKRIRLEHRLSNDTCFLVSAQNFTDLKKRLQECSYGRLLNDDSLKDVKKQLFEFIAGEIQGSELPEGLTLDDLMAIPSGEAAFAMMKPTGSDVPFVVAVDFGDSKATVDKLIASFSETTDTESEYKKTKHGGVDLHEFHYKGDDVDPKSPTSQAIAVFVAGSTLVGTNLVTLSKSLIDNWNGAKADSLANTKAFQYIRQASRHNDQTPSVFWYLDFNMMLKGMLEGSTDFAANMVRGNLPAFGLDQFRAMGGSFELSTKKYDIIGRLVGYVEQPTSGILNVFRFPEAKLALPPWAPKGAVGIATMNWDIETAYTGTRDLANALIGKGNFAKAIQKLANDPMGPRVHVKLDVIDQLNGKLYIVQSPPILVDDEPQDGPTLIAAEVKEEVQAKQIMARLLGGNENFESRDFGGSRIYTSKDEDLKLSITIAHGCVMVCDGPELLEATISIEDATKGVVASRHLQRLIKELPENASVVSLQETSQQFGVLYNYLRQVAVPNLPKVGKLPDFSTLKHYFLPSAAYIVPTEQGFIQTSFSLQLKVGN